MATGAESKALDTRWRNRRAAQVIALLEKEGRALFLAFTLLTTSLVPVALGTSGCATNQAVAFQTLEGVAHGVDNAMAAYADAVVAGKVDQATQVKVRDLKGRYEKAFLIAVTAARADLKSPAPADLTSITSALVELAKGRTR